MGVAAQIEVLAPVAPKKIGRYRGKTGVFVIRYQGDVLYIGWSTDIYGTCTRYFCKNASLAAYEFPKANFELILTTKTTSKKLAQVLRQKLQPTQQKNKLPPKLNAYKRRQHQLLYNQYCLDSFFVEDLGEAKSDT